MYYLILVCFFRQAFGSEVGKLYQKFTKTHIFEKVVHPTYSAIFYEMRPIYKVSADSAESTVKFFKNS